LGRGLCPLPINFLNFLSRYAAFWVQSDAFSDITRPVPNSQHSQPADSSDIIKPASAKLGKGCRAYFKGFFTGVEKRLKGQDVRSQEALHLEGIQTKGKDSGTGYTNRGSK